MPSIGDSSSSSSPDDGIGMPALVGPLVHALLARFGQRRRRPPRPRPARAGRASTAVRTCPAGVRRGVATSARRPRRRSRGRRVGAMKIAAPAAADLLAVADVDQRQGSREVRRGAEVDGQARRAQRPPEADRLAEQPAPVDLRPEGRLGDGRIGHGVAPLSRRRRPRSACGGPGRRGPGGCPPRT